MSSSRVVRGSKGRILLGIFVIVALTIIIACFNNILNQLSETRKNYEQCHQQQENLSTQLQVIFDYKQRLEKSLKTEKAEHQQTKKELDARLEEEQTNHEKSVSEINLKFSSLQQHYNILQAEYNDFKEESSKIQRQQLNEVNDLQSKLKELEGQFKQSIKEKDKNFEHLKTQYAQIQVDKENLESQMKGTLDGHIQSESDINHLKKVNFELTKEIEELKKKLPTQNEAQADDTNIKPPEVKQTDNEPKDPNDNGDNVLPAPNNDLHPNQKSSTPSSSSLVSKASFDAVAPIHVPIVTSSKTPNKQAEPPALPLPYKRVLPAGVPPVPAAAVDDSKPKPEEEKDVRDEINNGYPNRYRSNIIVNEMAKEEAEKQSALKVEAGDRENKALEVFDPPLNNLDAFGIEDPHEVKRVQQNNAPGIQVEGVKAQGHNKAYDAQNNGDYDKEVMNDMQLEEEAEDDDPDYGDHMARKDPAVRN
ncbi:hypothetical protein PPYR_14718 [Photinus pyralis]|uniref:Golgi integral membrane protein 4 n=3 Tax=Photinus pyralis TaxID=7054 RepID=A0A5N4A668_PHOPY|nr:Golgi integral membrane protein 4-like [Photinus pyralis]KAB0792759.1 hypothetical protein PPYR_14718 [Photinus pyralis]